MTTRTIGYEDLIPLMTRMTGDEKHAVAASSTLNVVWTLYDRILRIDPANPRDPDRDRFLLSKGHGPMAYYTVLAAKGFIPIDLLDGFARFDSPLGHHPDRELVPGVEISSGSLGHGLPMAVGVAIGINLSGRAGRVFTLIGDGELGEGSNHESIAVAGRFGLSRLTTIIVDNRSPYLGWPGGIASRFEVEGWITRTVDGRDLMAIEDALDTLHPDSPLAVVIDMGINHD